MQLASTLSPREVQMSLSSASKKSKKTAPTPKYICLPTDQQLQDNVKSLDSSDPLLAPLVDAVRFHGQLPDIEISGKSGDISQRDWRKRRKSVLMQRKQTWLAKDGHDFFWSHLSIGVNRVIRLLESSLKEQNPTSGNLSVVCVLLDSAWLPSQLGHHLAHLCSATNIPLISIKPAGSLVQMFTTTLYKFKRVLAIGICSSPRVSPEISDWLKQIYEHIGPLRLVTEGSSNGTQLPATLKRSASITLEVKPIDRTEPNPEPWDQYKIDTTKLYVYNPRQLESITLDQLWPLLRVQHVSRVLSPEDQTLQLDGLEHLPVYQPPVVNTVPVQTPEQRKRKRKKRSKSKSEINASMS